MPAWIAALTTHPSRQFRESRSFYLRYDAACALLCLGLLALRPLAFPRSPTLGLRAWLIAFPLCVYAAIVAQLCEHNAVHGNFPRAINRAVGELLGFLVVVRFASWTLVHLRHHRFADDRDRDPHPNFASFWKTALHTIVHVEQQLMQETYDRWGDTPELRAAERRRARVSYAASLLLLITWLAYLGPSIFFALFLPANALGALFVIHFNWVTHGALDERPYRPVNLDHGWFWLGNRLFFGIYMHANHHARPSLFNPARLAQPERAAPRAESIGALP